MRSFTPLALLLVARASSDEQWEAWKADHAKNYAADEEEYRHQVFSENLAAAREQQKSNPLATFGPNQFSDLTATEFQQRLMGWVPDTSDLPAAPKVNITVALPTDKDWTGVATTPIKDQGACGSCWAFSATEQLESDLMLQSGTMMQLAPQELVDCKGDHTRRSGCNGGFPSAGYKVIQQLGGMEAESDYPYTARNGYCRFSKNKVKATIQSYQSVGTDNEEEMMNYVLSTGPLSVCGMAGTWQSYSGGIMSNCPQQGRDGHCFQIVGFGSENGNKYWKVRNSWGQRWGEDGFIRLAYGSNQCGITQAPTKVVASVAGFIV